MSRTASRWLGLAGVGLLVWLFARVDLGQLWGHVQRFGWGLLPFVVLEGVADVPHAVATRLAFGAAYRTIPIADLWRIRIAGAAVNYVTPTATLGGEVAKVALFERYVPREQAAAAVLVDKLSYVLAQLLFAGGGTALLLWWIPMDRTTALALFLGSGLITVGCLGFLFFQVRGGLDAVVRRVFGSRAADALRRLTGDIDESLQGYYREHPLDLLRSIGWHVVGFCAGVVATWLFLWWVLGHGSWRDAAAVWMIGTLFDMVAFAVPAGVGTQEGGRVLVFHLLGLPVAAGLAFAVALRIEQGFYVALGFLLLLGGRAATPRPLAAGGLRQKDDP